MGSFSKLLKELRMFKGLLQKDVAEQLNINKNTYQTYESGRNEPSYDLLIKIADYYNITIDELIGREPKPTLQEGQDNDITELIKSYKKLNKEQRQHVRIVISTFLKDKDKIYREIFDDENSTDIFKRG